MKYLIYENVLNEQVNVLGGNKRLIQEIDATSLDEANKKAFEVLKSKNMSDTSFTVELAKGN
jgi:hypothetical protein